MSRSVELGGEWCITSYQGAADLPPDTSIADSGRADPHGQPDRSRAMSSISTAMSKGSSARPTALRV